MNESDADEDPLIRALLAARPVMTDLDRDDLLQPARFREPSGVHMAPGSRPPLNVGALDARARVAELLGDSNQAGSDQVAKLYAARRLLNTEEAQAAAHRVLKAAAVGRIYLAIQRGYTLRRCPVCSAQSVIPVEDDRGRLVGILECQNDECSDDPGTLRRFSLDSRLPTDPYARVTLAEVAAFTGKDVDTWDKRLRRKKIKPVGKRKQPGRGRPEREFEWRAFLPWVDEQEYETLTTLRVARV